MGDTLSITIRFGTMSIPLNIPREQEYAYRQAEKLIKEKYGFYTSKYPGQSENIYLIMTMVDMAVQAKQNELALDVTPVAERLAPLLVALTHLLLQFGLLAEELVLHFEQLLLLDDFRFLLGGLLGFPR